MRTFMQILRWTTNIATTIMLVLVAYIVGTHLVEPNAFSGPGLSNKEIYMSVTMGLMFIGALIAFWKRILGGILSVVCFVIFAIINGTIMQGMVFYSFLVIGIVNLVLGYYYKNIELKALL